MQHDLSQDSDLVHTSSLPPLLEKSNCVISKENLGVISPLFLTSNTNNITRTTLPNWPLNFKVTRFFEF